MKLDFSYSFPHPLRHTKKLESYVSLKAVMTIMFIHFFFLHMTSHSVDAPYSRNAVMLRRKRRKRKELGDCGHTSLAAIGRALTIALRPK